MAAPQILRVNPPNLATEVVLGTRIIVSFDQLIDHATIMDATFSLTGPGQTAIVTPADIASSPDFTIGREYIIGTFTFDDSSGQTVATFTPSKPLRPNLSYTVLIAGGSALFASAAVRNLAGEVMANSYTWTFQTGDLNVVIPPQSSPLADAIPEINPGAIKLIPRKSLNVDMTQEIDIVFPANIDSSSVNLSDILLSIEPVLGDLNVVLPPDLTATATIAGNKIKIAIASAL